MRKLPTGINNLIYKKIIEGNSKEKTKDKKNISIAEMVALCTAIGAASSVGFLTMYLSYIGRPDLLLESIGDSKPMLAVFGATLIAFPPIIVLSFLPAIILISLLKDFINKKEDKAKLNEIPTAVFFSIIFASIAYIIRLKVCDIINMRPILKGWLEVTSLLPILLIFSSIRLRGFAITKKTDFIKISNFKKLYLPGLLMWVSAALTCWFGANCFQDAKSAGQLLQAFLSVLIVSLALLASGFLYVRWRMEGKTRLLPRLLAIATTSFVLAIILCRPAFDDTMKSVTYHVGIREHGGHTYLIAKKVPPEHFKTGWNYKEINNEFFTICARSIYKFGNNIVLCPTSLNSNYSIREKSRDECTLLKTDKVTPWPTPKSTTCK